MRALVIYESVYGNTRTVAEAIADGMEAMPPRSFAARDDAPFPRGRSG